VVTFNRTTFTTQYGAVQWIASTSPTTPLASDARWSSSKAPFVSGGIDSYVPPISLATTHGDTVYLWVMDSANHISSAASQVVP
jgi:hypothetical protein